MAVDVVFEIPLNALHEFLADVAAQSELEPEVQVTAAASGGGDLATILIALTSTTIGSLTTLATVWIKRSGTVEVGGQKVTGISRSVADQLARSLVDSQFIGLSLPKASETAPVYARKLNPKLESDH